MARKAEQAGTRRALAAVAREKALLPFRGGEEGNIAPLVAPFPKWSVAEADRLWCAAFVLYCCREAGFEIPYSPAECVTCSLAGCGGWEEYAMADPRIEYHGKGADFTPEPGDIVLYDHVFCDREHDHIGVVVEVGPDAIVAAEGNVDDTNRSALVRRPRDGYIRAYIRLPDGYRYLG